jgi:hypothetical protein
LSLTPRRRKGDRTQLIEDDGQDDISGGGANGDLGGGRTTALPSTLNLVDAGGRGGGYGAVAFSQSEATAYRGGGAGTDINLNLGKFSMTIGRLYV